MVYRTSESVVDSHGVASAGDDGVGNVREESFGVRDEIVLGDASSEADSDAFAGRVDGNAVDQFAFAVFVVKVHHLAEMVDGLPRGRVDGVFLETLLQRRQGREIKVGFLSKLDVVLEILNVGRHDVDDLTSVHREGQHLLFVLCQLSLTTYRTKIGKGINQHRTCKKRDKKKHTRIC